MTRLLRAQRTSVGVLGFPTAVAVALSLLAGVLQVINEIVLTPHPTIRSGVAVVLVFLAGVGITPLRGTAFRAALHLPDWASKLASAGLSAAVVAVSAIPMATAAHAAIAAVITVVSALGFTPAVDPVGPVAATRPAAPPPHAG